MARVKPWLLESGEPRDRSDVVIQLVRSAKQFLQPKGDGEKEDERDDQVDREASETSDTTGEACLEWNQLWLVGIDSRE